MLYILSIISIIEVVIVTVPALLVVAYVTIAERKTMASMQRRLGPNTTGYFGLLQAFADALKLLLKEYVAPSRADTSLFFLAPFITLVFSLLSYAVISYGPGTTVFDYNLGILYLLAVSSLATYGILLAGWSANSKYAFLGSVRSTAQLISYELILSSGILIVVLLSASLSLTTNIEAQRMVWFILPLFPVFIMFFIGAVAETNRAPFDLAEAESELVSGFMTEHAAVNFVFFFLAEYASIVVICLFAISLFLAGYLINFKWIVSFLALLHLLLDNLTEYLHFIADTSNLITDYLKNFTVGFWNISAFSKSLATTTYVDLVLYFKKFTSYNISVLMASWNYSIAIAFKICVMVFIFIWVRASFPRTRFDELMSFCWTILLPFIIGIILLIPCIMYSFDILPSNVNIF